MILNEGGYKVKVRHISAAESFRGLEHCTHAYLGISMNNPLFRHPSFAVVVKWMQSMFASPYLLLGDYLNRWNERIFFSPSIEACGEKALEQGDRLLQTISANHNFLDTQVFRWQDLLNDPAYQNIADLVTELYRTNPAFHASIKESAEKFIERQLERGSHPIVSIQEAYRFSTEYLIEELSVFFLLVTKGINVQIYPGTLLPILTQLHNTKGFELPVPFQDGVFVDLRIKKK